MKIIPYGHQSIDQNDIDSVVNALKSDYLTQGPIIEQFEKALASYVNAKYAVVFSSGTAALHAAYFAIGLTSGDEFITSPMTFAATSNAGLYLGAKPVFADIKEGVGNMDPQSIKSTITNKTKLIAPVHYAGFPVDLVGIQQIAQKLNLRIVEDASHALGATYRDTKIGSCAYCDITTFSFHPVKHITTGEGGAATTNSKKLYDLMCLFRTHGITKNAKQFINSNEGGWYHEMQYLGYNYRITDFQAALGLSQLKKMNDFLKKRRTIAKTYDQAFSNNPYFDILHEEEKSTSAYHLYPIILKDIYKRNKKNIFDALRKNNIGVQVHYIPVYLHPYYQQLGYKRGSCPKAENFYEKEISIPMFPGMDTKNINYTLDTIMSLLKRIVK